MIVFNVFCVGLVVWVILVVVLVVLVVVLKQVEAVALPLLLPVLKPPPGPPKPPRRRPKSKQNEAQKEKQNEKERLARSLVHSRCPRGGFGDAGLDSDLHNAQFGTEIKEKPATKLYQICTKFVSTSFFFCRPFCGP